MESLTAPSTHGATHPSPSVDGTGKNDQSSPCHPTCSSYYGVDPCQLDVVEWARATHRRPSLTPYPKYLSSSAGQGSLNLRCLINRGTKRTRPLTHAQSGQHPGNRNRSPPKSRGSALFCFTLLRQRAAMYPVPTSANPHRHCSGPAHLPAHPKPTTAPAITVPRTEYTRLVTLFSLLLSPL